MSTNGKHFLNFFKFSFIAYLVVKEKLNGNSIFIFTWNTNWSKNEGFSDYLQPYNWIFLNLASLKLVECKFFQTFNRCLTQITLRHRICCGIFQVIFLVICKSLFAVFNNIFFSHENSTLTEILQILENRLIIFIHHYLHRQHHLVFFWDFTLIHN